MYYHIIIEIKEKDESNKNRILYEFDKTSESEIINDIIKPYKNQNEVHFDGYFLKNIDILRIAIKKTHKTSKEINDYKNARVSPNILMWYNREDGIQDDEFAIDITKDLFKKVDNTSEFLKNQTKDTSKDFTRVFIVHGHDDLAKTEVARFIEKLALEPIILHEQSSQGMTIIEKIEHFSNVGFGVILYTPCDMGGKKDEQNLSPRARQNVIFEHGYLIGKIGRKNVCALVKNDVEKPNDISGVVYVNMDSQKGWHLLLAKELKDAGYSIDLNKLL